MTDILIVDDEADIRTMVCLALKASGCTVQTAEDGFDLLKQMEHTVPDIIALDVMMPGPDTKEITNRIQQMGISTKILLFTALRFTADELETYLHLPNVVDVIYKPFTILDFVEKINQFLPKDEAIAIPIAG